VGGCVNEREISEMRERVCARACSCVRVRVRVWRWKREWEREREIERECVYMRACVRTRR
jgi:hypothetical protein